MPALISRTYIQRNFARQREQFFPFLSAKKRKKIEIKVLWGPRT